MIRIMLCYARSGGTMLNKVLCGLPDVVVLSEVNPLGGGWGEEKEKSYDNVKEQAKNWYGIKINSDDFTDSILELHEKCAKSNKDLIIRDWSFVNFSSHEKNNFDPPDKFLILKCLEDKVELRSFVFLRDSIDVWISRGCPDIDIFYTEYLNYLNEIKDQKIKVYKYEDFISNPESELREICNYLGLKYSVSAVSNFYEIRNVNGDTQKGIFSRGNRLNKIKKQKRKFISYRDYKLLSGCQKMITSNKMFGYPVNYFNNPFELFRIMPFWIFHSVFSPVYRLIKKK